MSVGAVCGGLWGPSLGRAASLQVSAPLTLGIRLAAREIEARDGWHVAAGDVGGRNNRPTRLAG